MNVRPMIKTLEAEQQRLAQAIDTLRAIDAGTTRRGRPPAYLKKPVAAESNGRGRKRKVA